jgi:hypothetical protein
MLVQDGAERNHHAAAGDPGSSNVSVRPLGARLNATSSARGERLPQFIGKLDGICDFGDDTSPHDG